MFFSIPLFTFAETKQREMAEKNINFFKTEGVIYAKPSRVVKSKKDGKEYEFKSVILELKREHKGKTYRELPEFQLGFGVGIEDFAIGDKVFINFSLAGKEISDTFHKTELRALYIGHADLQVGSDMRDVGGEDPFKKKKQQVDMAIGQDEIEEENDLPF